MTKHTICDLYVIFDDQKGDLVSSEVHETFPYAIISCEELTEEEKLKHEEFVKENPEYLSPESRYTVMSIQEYVFKVKDESHANGRWESAVELLFGGE
jgi:hypothetical protein